MSIPCILIVVEFREKAGVGNGVMTLRFHSLSPALRILLYGRRIWEYFKNLRVCIKDCGATVDKV